MDIFQQLLLAGIALVITSETSAKIDRFHRHDHYIESTRSKALSELRKNIVSTVIRDCGLVVREPFGYLERVYKRNNVKHEQKCLWKLSAPVDHIIHINAILYTLEDETLLTDDDADTQLSSVSLYDGSNAIEENLIVRIPLSVRNKMKTLTNSFSSDRDMIVVIDYYDNENFSAQNILVNYEFLDVKEIKRFMMRQKPARF